MSDGGNGLAGIEQLFDPARKKRRYQNLTLPVSQLRVRIQSLTEREMSEYQAESLSATGNLSRGRLIDASRRLIIRCLVDSAGNRICNESHVAMLADWDSADTAFLYAECAKWCGTNRDDIEDLAKNSEGITVEG